MTLRIPGASPSCTRASSRRIQSAHAYVIASGCTGWAPNAARAAVADSIWGPWEELGNPAVGSDADLTFHSQSTYVLPVRGRPGAFIFMADRWRPEDAIDGRYIWLPILFRNDRIEVEWADEWDLGVFDTNGSGVGPSR